jgi:hypothetical protein
MAHFGWIREALDTLYLKGAFVRSDTHRRSRGRTTVALILMRFRMVLMMMLRVPIPLLPVGVISL